MVVESIERLPTVEHWTVMVQREVADRFFAVPRTKAYGAVSVLVQLAAERTGFHPVSRTVFRPPPNVDSALVAFHRRRNPPALEWRRLKRVVEGAFAHRRKRLANSLELAGVADRNTALAALAELALAPAIRAEELAPDEFVRLAAALP
jgi:16S rRNA (adenine1518-N6/adenine1519-N6)-dimethyltransferase